MKITCTKCGKRFNAEQHMHICPKCNHYHSQVRNGNNLNIDEKPVKKYRWETDPIELDDEENFFKRKQKETEIASLDPPTYPKSELPNREEPDYIETIDGLQANGAQNKPEENDFFSDVSSVGRKIGLAICIIIGFIMFIGSAIADFDEWSDEPDFWESGWDGSYTEETVAYGDSMEFETFTVNVGDVCGPEFDGLEVEEGYKLVQIDLKTTSPYDYDDEYINTDLTLWHSYDDGAGYSENGYNALYIDDLTNDIVLQNDLINSGLVMEAHYSGTYFCIFEIPEEADEVTLEITSFVAEDDDETAYSWDESIRMPIEL